MSPEESTVETYRIEEPAEFDGGSDCTSPSGHSWEPMSEGGDRDTDPMTASFMHCMNCEERRDVEEGDLYGYVGAYQYPEGVESDG